MAEGFDPDSVEMDAQSQRPKHDSFLLKIPTMESQLDPNSIAFTKLQDQCVKQGILPIPSEAVKDDESVSVGLSVRELLETVADKIYHEEAVYDKFTQAFKIALNDVEFGFQTVSREETSITLEAKVSQETQHEVDSQTSSYTHIQEVQAENEPADNSFVASPEEEEDPLDQLISKDHIKEIGKQLNWFDWAEGLDLTKGVISRIKYDTYLDYEMKGPEVLRQWQSMYNGTYRALCEVAFKIDEKEMARWICWLGEGDWSSICPSPPIITTTAASVTTTPVQPTRGGPTERVFSKPAVSLGDSVAEKNWSDETDDKLMSLLDALQRSKRELQMKSFDLEHAHAENKDLSERLEWTQEELKKQRLNDKKVAEKIAELQDISDPLDKLISKDHIYEIGMEIKEWKKWAVKLKLAQGQISDIRDDRSLDYGQKGPKILELWRNKYNATYRALCKVGVAVEEREMARWICKLANGDWNHICPPSPVSPIEHVEKRSDPAVYQTPISKCETMPQAATDPENISVEQQQFDIAIGFIQGSQEFVDFQIVAIDLVQDSKSDFKKMESKVRTYQKMAASLQQKISKDEIEKQALSAEVERLQEKVGKLESEIYPKNVRIANTEKRFKREKGLYLDLLQKNKKLVEENERLKLEVEQNKKVELLIKKLEQLKDYNCTSITDLSELIKELLESLKKK